MPVLLDHNMCRSGSADTTCNIAKVVQSVADQNQTLTEENLWPLMYSQCQCDIQA